MLCCAKCAIHACERMAQNEYPKNCPSTVSFSEARKAYLSEENFLLGKVASEVSMSRNGMQPRIIELLQVIEGCGYHKIGIAFCIGFAAEAKALTRVLEYHGLQVESVICKVGGIDKSLQAIEEGGNAMCNPIGQAQLLNEAETDFNIALGLCIGHDSLFFRYSNAPVTVMATKDKVLAHNPMGALYLADGYYHGMLFPDK